MEYRAVGKRCAVSVAWLQLPVSEKETLAILQKKGFKVLDVDLVSLARQCIGTSIYRRGAKPSEAPAIVDCSSFIKWLYGQRGIWLPRRSIQQRELGESVPLDNLIAGDVIFVSGRINYHLKNKNDGVGHVGIYTDSGTVVHAADTNANVVKSPLQRFIGKDKFRGARRYISVSEKVITLEVPENKEVEIADDLRWIVLQSLPYEK